MQTIPRSKAILQEFDARVDPAIRVEQGESFVVETEDAGCGLIRSKDMADKLADLWVRKATPPKGNPVGGPIYIKGAVPGDLLEVQVERIEVDGQGFTFWEPGRTDLGDSTRWPSLNQAHVTIIKHEPGPSGTTRDGRGIVSPKLSWDLAPMVGCIGVAPQREVTTTTFGQDLWGGNMDIRDVKEGTKVYFNVYHEGGLLFLGDVHATQADTEYYGVADETRAQVQASCRVIKNKRIPFIRLELEDSIVAVRTGKSLDVMVDQAMEDLMSWMVEDYGLDPKTAYLHTCINPDVRINVYQCTLGLATLGAKISKKYLKS